jgi:hypothetical protein
MAVERQPLPRSVLWSVPAFVSAASTDGWIDRLQIDLVRIVGDYFCATYEWLLSQTSAATTSAETKASISQSQDWTRVCGKQNIGCGYLQSYLAVRVRPTPAAVDWHIFVGLAKVLRPTSKVDNYYGVTAYSQRYRPLVPTTRIGGYVTTGSLQRLSTTSRLRNGLDGRYGVLHPSAETGKLNQSDSTVIGLVCNLQTNILQVYLDDEPLLVESLLADETSSPVGQVGWTTAFGHPIQDIGSCRPYAAAKGVSAEFEFLPEWRPPITASSGTAACAAPAAE